MGRCAGLEDPFAGPSQRVVVPPMTDGVAPKDARVSAREHPDSPYTDGSDALAESLDPYAADTQAAKRGDATVGNNNDEGGDINAEADVANDASDNSAGGDGRERKRRRNRRSRRRKSRSRGEAAEGGVDGETASEVDGPSRTNDASPYAGESVTNELHTSFSTPAKKVSA